jgi:hypothetical protein
MKAKRSSRKRGHWLNDKSETRVFLAMKNKVYLLQKEFVGGPTIYCSKQNKIKLKAKVKMLQEKFIEYEAIKL